MWRAEDRLRIDDEARRLLRAGVVHAGPVVVGAAGPALDAELERLGTSLAQAHAGRAPGAIAGLAPARDLYRAFGLDPTRTRPSSEALLRRVLQGKGLPRILNAVDVCDFCSLQFLLPIGLYDAGQVRGPVSLRRGLPGEAYQGIRKDAVHLEGRPVLADEDGPFGNPTSDSFRTAMTPATRALVMVIFAPAEYARDTLEAHVAKARAAIERHLAPAGETVGTSGTVEPA